MYWAIAGSYARSALAEEPNDSGLSPLDLPAHAEPESTPPRTAPVVDVQRTESALDCPDTLAFRAVLAERTDRAGVPEPQHIDIVFSRRGDEYEALLVLSGWRHGRRSLHSADSRCDGVAQASVVALSVLLDPSTEAVVERPSLPASSAQKSRERVVEPSSSEVPHVPPVAQRRRDIALADPAALAAASPASDMDGGSGLWLGLGAATTYGFVGALSLGFEGGLELTVPRYAFALHGFTTTSETTRDTVGSTSVRLTGGHLCASRVVAEANDRLLALRLGGQFSAATVRGEAAGDYETLEPVQNRPWLALGLSAQLAGQWEEVALGWSTTLSLLFPLTRESYVISGESGVYRTAYTTSKAAIWLGIDANMQIL